MSLLVTIAGLGSAAVLVYWVSFWIGNKAGHQIGGMTILGRLATLMLIASLVVLVVAFLYPVYADVQNRVRWQLLVLALFTGLFGLGTGLLGAWLDRSKKLNKELADLARRKLLGYERRNTA